MRALRFLLLLSLGASPLSAAPVIREEGALYLDELLPKPLRLRTLGPSAIYYESDLGRYLGTIPAGQNVELQAIKGDIYRVKGRAQQGGVAGWIRSASLSPLAPGLLEKLEANAARAALVSGFIERHEVAVNMTRDEVLASVGKPQRTSARTDGEGRDEIWEYVAYERVPQQVTGYDSTGRLVTSYVYVKEPVGQRAVAFTNGVVSSVEESEGTLSRAAVTRIVVPPVTVY